MSAIQAVLFNKHFWTPDMALAELTAHGLYPIKPVRETANYYRYRLIEPGQFRTFVTKKTRYGIEFVIGFT